MSAIQLRNSQITLEKILDPTTDLPRKTKIVCTLGPACWDTETLVQLIDQGMSVARLNFSHGDHESHGSTIARLLDAMSERPEKNVAIMLDTKGPEIRTGFLESGDKVSLVKGQLLELVTDYAVLGNSERLACSYKELANSVEVGQPILAADGSLVLEVEEVRESSVMVRVMNNCELGERKNMNLPGVEVQLPTLTEKDVQDLQLFALKHPVDMIAASFVRKPEDIQIIRETLGEAGEHIKIIAKIENQEGLHNYEAILEATDGIMVARGDLGMEIPPEKVFLAQKMMIRKANIAGKPVITATQMLESMITNPRPTRAECTDVANAVLDGTDCVMLSGETANGSFPAAAVSMMAHISAQAENCINYEQLFQAVRGSALEQLGVGCMSTSEAVASSAVKTAMDMSCKMIVVISQTGRSAQQVCKYRPSQPVLVLTERPEVARQVEGLCRGARCFTMGSMLGSDSLLLRAVEMGKEMGICKPGDTVVAVHGMIEGRPGSTNMIKVLHCS